MVGFSAAFFEEAHISVADLLGRMGKGKNLMVAKREPYFGLVTQLMEFNSGQHSLLCFLHEKTSRKGETPSDSCAVGVGNTPHLTRDVHRMSDSFGWKEAVTKFGGIGVSEDTSSNTKSRKPRKLKCKQIQTQVLRKRAVKIEKIPKQLQPKQRVHLPTSDFNKVPKVRRLRWLRRRMNLLIRSSMSLGTRRNWANKRVHLPSSDPNKVP